MPTFFGLTSHYRTQIFEQIHEIVFNGQGGYSYNEVYNMPIWLRRLTFNYINQWYKEQNEQNENAAQPQNKDIPKGPNISPSYSTKASK